MAPTFQLFESISHLWGAKRLLLCNSEPYIARKAITYKVAIDIIVARGRG